MFEVLLGLENLTREQVAREAYWLGFGRGLATGRLDAVIDSEFGVGYHYEEEE